MKVAVIGATGHVGTYLVPRLVRAGHEVIALSRGDRAPYRDDDAWAEVTRVQVDRDAEDAAGTFGARVAELGADVVVDMICFTPASAAQLVDSLRGRVQRLVMCSTIWVFGTLTEVPAREDDESEPWGEYGIGKAAIEQLLEAESLRSDGVPSITLRPGHISGPGWHVINPVGNLDPRVWVALANGEKVLIPGLGLETLHHVHADDVAQAFQQAIELPAASGALRFNVTSERALTLRGFAESAASWFGREAELGFVSFDEFRAGTTPQFANTTFEHMARSHSMSVEKARNELGYVPRYSSLEAVAEAVDWLRSSGAIDLPPFALAER